MEKDIEKLDIKTTLMSNLLWLWFTALIIIFIIFSFNVVRNITDEAVKIIGLTVFCFAVLKIMSMIGGPTLVFQKIGDKGKAIYR